jgi:predicted dehydrogenase
MIWKTVRIALVWTLFKYRRKNKMNFGLVGASVRGMFLVTLAMEHGHKLVAVADPSEKNGQTAVDIFNAKGCNVKWYDSDREMFETEKLDGVFIGSSDNWHYANLMTALDYKVPVYCEKPLVQTVEQCKEVFAKLEANPIIFCGGLEMRYSPLFMQVKKMISEGEIGKPVMVNAYEGVPGGGMHNHPLYRKKVTGRSLLLQKGVHDIDLMNWFLGEPKPVRVYGSGGMDFFGSANRPQNHQCTENELKTTFTAPYLNCHTFEYDMKCPYGSEVDMEDNYIVLADYKNSTRGCFTLAYNSPDYFHEFLIIGTKGKITAIFRHRANTAEIRLMKNSDPENEYIIRPGLNGGHGGGDAAIVQDFIESILKGTQPKAGMKATHDAALIAAAAQDAIEQKNVINL